MIHVDDLSRSLIAFEQISTLVIVVELSQSSWLAAGVAARIPASAGAHGVPVARAKGEGMGMAKAAELNGYPGPAHVLSLARLRLLQISSSKLQQFLSG
jgi:hypothetical protein